MSPRFLPGFGLALAAALLLTAPAKAQGDAGKKVRTLGDCGVSLALPEGWSWTEEESTELDLRYSVSSTGLPTLVRVTAQKDRTLGDGIATIQFWSRNPNAPWRKLRFSQDTSLGGRKTIVGTAERDSGRGGTSTVRVRAISWQGALLLWQEEVPSADLAAAEAPLAAARAALKITEPTPAPAATVTFGAIGMKFALPKDALFGRVKPKLDKITDQTLVFEAVMAQVSEGKPVWASVTVDAAPVRMSNIKDLVIDRAQLTSHLKDPSDFETDDEFLFRGQKARRYAFSGIDANGLRRRETFVFLKRKDTRVVWHEVTPADTRTEAEALFAKLRAAASFP